jgi:hypothetical protein
MSEPVTILEIRAVIKIKTPSTPRKVVLGNSLI